MQEVLDYHELSQMYLTCIQVHQSDDFILLCDSVHGHVRDERLLQSSRLLLTQSLLDQVFALSCQKFGFKGVAFLRT